MNKAKSIKTKTAITAVSFMAVLTVAITVLGYKLFYAGMMERYAVYADTVLEYAYRASDAYSFGDMIADRDMPEGYEELRTRLNAVKDGSEIEYLYAIYFEDINDLHSLHYAINAKSQEDLLSGQSLSEMYSYMGRPATEGEFQNDALLTFQNAVKTRSRESGILEGYSDIYGHVLNGHRVIYDSRDNAVGLICVEIDNNRIHTDLEFYVRTVILIATILTAIIIIIYLLNIQNDLIGPILRIEKSTDSFVKQIQNNTEPAELVFENVQIDSGTELCSLAENIESLAGSVTTYMANLEAAASERERIVTELTLAKRIQADMLPNIFPAFPDRRDFDIYATMDPAKEVGGDFYDFFLIDESHLGLVIADVSGKGVPAALFMMTSKMLVQNYAMAGLSPAEVLKTVNEQICSNNREEMFVTMWLGILDTATGKIIAANAGHEYPALMAPGGEFELLKTRHGFIIGGMPGVNYNEYELTLMPGSKLFLYTDGIPEAINTHEEMFGTDRMLDALNAEPSASPEKILLNVRKSVDGFVGDAEPFDDLTMLCVEYKGSDRMKSDSNSLIIPADVKRLSEVLSFLEHRLEETGCSPVALTQICIAAEEIYVNIASYAYTLGTGPVMIEAEITDEPHRAVITFTDGGIPFNPLQKEDPDVTLSAEERKIGGLGIYMTKKSMDNVRYEYRDGKNILTLVKNI